MPVTTPDPRQSIGLGAASTGAVPAKHGLLNVLSNSELNRLEKEKNEAEQRQQQPYILNLAGYIRGKWEQARFAKEPIKDILLESQRQRNAEYDEDKLLDIREMGGSEEYMPLTAVKCRAASAWLNDIALPAGDKTWGFDPTPVPELSEEIVRGIVEYTMAAADSGTVQNPQEASEFAGRMRREVKKQINEQAKEHARNMEDLVHDQMIQGKWEDAFNEFIDDLVTFKTAFIKGPIIRRVPQLTWGEGREPVVKNKLQVEFERVSPFDMYPGPEARDIDDSFLIQRMRLTRSYLQRCKGVPGFDDGALDLAMQQFGLGSGSNRLDIDQQRSENEDRPFESILGAKDNIEALEFWGSVPGWMLLEWGMKVEDPNDEYEINAWVINTIVVKAVLNPDPLKRRPYSKASYENNPGSFWGKSIPERMREIQNICNATVRSLINNLAVASGPQVAINDIDRLPDGEDVSNMTPWRIWQFTNKTQSNTAPIQFFNPNPMTRELMEVYKTFEQMADDHTGIPAYAHGNPEIGGAGSTASGLSMLLNSSAKGIKQVVKNIDVGVIQPCVRRLYDHNMLYSEDPDIKGDVKIKARGIMSMLIKENIHTKRMQFLQLVTNDLDYQITGIEGRANLLREMARDLDIDVDKIIPKEEDLKTKQEELAMQQQAVAQEDELKQLAGEGTKSQTG